VTFRHLREAPPFSIPEPIRRAAKRQARAFVLAAGLAGTLLVAGAATAEPTSVANKRSEAQRVLGQIRQLDSSLAKAIEAYNLANIKLDRIARDQKRNAQTLVVARMNLGRAQNALQARLVALYTSGHQSGSTIEVLLGATSLEDLLNRIETVDRVSSQDSRVLDQVRTFRTQVQRQKVRLANARREQAAVVEARAASKAQIEGQLAERRQLLSSIQSEIARLQAAERARQAALERQARERLASRRAFVNDADLGIAAETPEAVVAPPSRYGGVVGIAMQYLGIPYKWGGASPSTGFDCSGFIMYVYAQVGVSLPHNAAAQFGVGVPVSRDQLQPGDLVFFDGLGHNGLYIGGGQFIHSPHTGDVVKISSLSDSWYAATWVGARRL
jgi:cell wall-associated NlpC family hydrolase